MDVILLGAGASTFSCSCSVARPPLGPDLFPALLSAHPEIRSILNDRAWQAFSGGRPFEEGMELAWEVGSKTIAPFLRTMAKYLSNFEPCNCADNGYRRMLAGLRHKLPRLCFSSLNYDLLFDRIVNGVGLDAIYDGPPGRNMAAILKPHGAANLLPDLGFNEMHNVSMVGGEVYFEGLQINVADSARAIAAWCDDGRNEVLAPVMSVYAAGKRTPYNGGWTLNQRRMWGNIVRDARRVVVIGVKLVEADTHLWVPLAANQGAVMYINPSADDQDSFRDWSRRERHHAPLEIVSDGFLGAVPIVIRRLTS